MGIARRLTPGVSVRRWLPAVAGAVVIVIGAGGAQAAVGALDPAFGSGGKVMTDLGTGSVDYAYAVAVQKDGKFVAAGLSDAGGSYDFALARYTKSGVLDAGFGTGGKVLSDLGAASVDYATAVAVQKDGKIVAAGVGNAGSSKDFALARYTKSGALDASFGTGGIVLSDLGAIDEVSAVAIQKDGKIVVAGFSDAGGTMDFALARYTKSGVLDVTFGTGGKVLSDLGSASNDYAYAVAVQKDGKIVAAGRSIDGGGDRDFALARYTKSGVLDAGFGTGGKVLTDLGGNEDEALAVAVQKDGKIVAAGFSNAGGSHDVALARYTKSGVLDAGFGTGGKVLSDLGSASVDEAYAVAVQKKGQIVVAGLSDAGGSYDFALARYTKSGVLDAGFGTGGKVLSDLGSASDDAVTSIAVQKDGRIVAAGWSSAGGSDDFALARYTMK